jgi:hypothetical protein
MGRKPKSAEVRAKFFTARTSGATLRQAGVSKTTGHYWLTEFGGVRPRARRPRPPLRLSLEERETISHGLAQKKTLRSPASSAGRCRRCRRRWRGTAAGTATAARADRLAVLRTSRPRVGKLADDPTLRRHVEEKLRLRWSPQQISRRLVSTILTMGRCGCPTRRSTPRCLCRPKPYWAQS